MIVYPPKNDKMHLAEGEKPPLIVFCHGGPTAHHSNGLEIEIQYFTSRGFMVSDVNYSVLAAKFRDLPTTAVIIASV
jgi:dipeptidyl aminopeptidase/acylaminoacyl peptidase